MWLELSLFLFGNNNAEQPAEQVVEERIEPEFPEHPFYPRDLKVLNLKY
jgi:hypothetical protein